MTPGRGEGPRSLDRVVLLKLGGSLITDKARPDTPRPKVLRRLAAEIAEGIARWPAGHRLILGHGSGSFGHEAAARYRIHEGLGDPDRLPGVPATQERAAALHHLVLEELSRAGLLTFSIAPSSSLVAAGGRPARFAAEPLVLALGAGLLPVVYGDVVMDREQGSAICSTESVFLALTAELTEGSIPIDRAFWAGATPGILGSDGRPIERIAPTDTGGARAVAGGAAETDVTGGMLHRLEAALELAEREIPSLIFDGSVPGHVAAALRGDPVPGTRVFPGNELPRHPR